MEISRDEAQEALGAIEDATKTSRALLRSWIVGIFVVGVILIAPLVGRLCMDALCVSRCMDFLSFDARCVAVRGLSSLRDGFA